jgi:hypothetical protein
MGAAKRRGTLEQRQELARTRPQTKRERMFHLLKLISKYNDREIMRFIDRRIKEG